MITSGIRLGRSWRAWGAVAAGAMLAVFASGCNTYYIPPPPVSVFLNNFTPAIVITAVDSAGNLVPATLQLQAAVNNSTNQTILYSVGQLGVFTPGGNNKLGFISSTGTYTAPAVLPDPNTVTVQGVAQVDPTQSATTNITLLNQAANPTGIAPAVVVAGTTSTFDIVGNFFASGAKVNMSGAQLGPVQLLSSHEIKVSAQVTTPGLLSLSVVNPNAASNTNAVAIRSQPSSPPTSSAVSVLVGAVGTDASRHAITATKAYVPEPGSLAVVNLETNKQIRSVVLPSGFQAALTAADPLHHQVVAASLSSNLLQLIDADQDQVTQSLATPVTGTTTADGKPCEICGLMVDSVRNFAIVDGATGYFTVNLTTGVASAPLAAPAAVNFAYDPATQRIYAPFTNTGGSGVNVIDLVAGTVQAATPAAGVALGAATDTAAFDPATAVLTAGDQSAGTFLDLNFNNATTFGSGLEAPATSYSITNGCAGAWDNVDLDFTSHLGWFANLGGCVAVASLSPAPATGPPGQPATLRWAQLPPAPDGLAWTNSPAAGPRSLAVYVGADGRAYGLALRQDGSELAKVDLARLQAANAIAGGSDVNQVDATDVTVNGIRVSALTYILVQ